MATKNAQKPDLKGWRGVNIYEWLSLANGDDGNPALVADAEEISVHITGTQGVGGVLDIEATNDVVSGSPTWSVLASYSASPTSGLLDRIPERFAKLRPKVSAGDGNTSYNVRMVVTRRG